MKPQTATPRSKRENAVPSGVGVDKSGLSLLQGNVAGIGTVIQRVQQSPSTLHPNELLYLQRAAGNRAVSNLLARETNHIQPKLRVGPANDHFEQEADQVARAVTSPRAGAPYKPQATGKTLVQRSLKFKPERLQGEVSKRGQRAGRLGFESTFSKIQRYLTAYWGAGDDMQLQATLLTKMKKSIKQWNNSYKRKTVDANQATKAQSLYELEQQIDIELPKVKDKIKSVNFMKTYTYGSEETKEMMISGIDDRLNIGKQMKHMEKHNIPMPANPDDLKFPDGKGGEKGTLTPQSEWKALTEQYKREKPFGLTPANRAALYSYTGDQYRWMNPAMANNKSWFQGTMNEKMGLNDERTNDKKWRKKAMNHNKEIGGMLISSLNKLPDWKQDKTLYRGETIPEDEAQQFKVGTVKTFPIFVSTSQSLSTPMSQLGSFKSPQRPWGIVYHIESSKSGKDVAPWSNSPGEEEILFAPNTKFQVTKVLSRDDTKKMLEVEVSQV